MQACLQDPEHGYYRRQAAIGRAGDFVTAPEISQVFGELIGLWCAVVWQQMGSPRGRAARRAGARARHADARCVARGASRCRIPRGARVSSSSRATPRSQPVQRATLSGEGVPLRWSADILPGAGPAIVIANEFIDTLPAAQWVFRGGAGTRAASASMRRAIWHSPTARPIAGLQLPAGTPEPGEGDIFEERTAALAGLRRQTRGARRAGRRLSSSTTATPGRASATRCRRCRPIAIPIPCSRPARPTSPLRCDFAAFAARDAGARPCLRRPGHAGRVPRRASASSSGPRG